MVPDASKHNKALKEANEHIVSARQNIVTYLDKTTKSRISGSSTSVIKHLISQMGKGGTRTLKSNL